MAESLLLPKKEKKGPTRKEPFLGREKSQA